jgi:hypothetical protein
MTHTQNPVEQHLTTSLVCSILGQMAAAQGHDITSLLPPDSALRAQLLSELRDLPISPELLAQHTMMSLMALLADADNAARLTAAFAQLLWQVLGDPSSGAPPALYKQAGVAVHAVLLQLFTLLPDQS